MTAFAVHDPDAILDYSFDWSTWLVEGESIDQSAWSGPDGLTLTGSVLENHAIVRVQVTDDTLVGQVVELVNHVESTDGQEDDRTLKLYIGNH